MRRCRLICAGPCSVHGRLRDCDRRAPTGRSTPVRLAATIRVAPTIDPYWSRGLDDGSEVRALHRGVAPAS
jgi:hypothetical protein